VIDKVLDELTLPEDSKILDAGCGTCVKTIHLARRGYKPVAADFSAAVLKMAREQVSAVGLASKIDIVQQDITSLSFEDDSFDLVLCWGVLMHIPQLEIALSELARIVKPGGVLMIGENNMYSLYSTCRRWARRVSGKKDLGERRTKFGLEHWICTDQGELLVRQMDPSWLRKKLGEQGFTQIDRFAGQFSELYTKTTHPTLQSLVFASNEFYFQYIGQPGASFGNVFLFRRN
jgi:ubiquinone/menaquinone biosynthesis C-methylase UbiE